MWGDCIVYCVGRRYPNLSWDTKGIADTVDGSMARATLRPDGDDQGIRRITVEIGYGALSPGDHLG